MSHLAADRVRLAWRGALVGVVIALGGWRVVEAAGKVTSLGDPYASFLLALPAAVAVAVWRQGVAVDEPDIHDRSMDFTVVALLVAMALAVGVLLPRRLGSFAGAAGGDALSIIWWTAASAVALFGIRATKRHLYSFLVLGMWWPLPLNAIAWVVPADAFGWFVGATILTVAAGGIVTGDRCFTGRTAAGRRVTCVAVGLVAEVAACHTTSLVPAALIVGPVALVASTRIAGLRLLAWPPMRAGAAPRRRSTAVVDLRRAVPVVAAIAVLAGLVPSATANAITGIRNDIPTERLVAFDRCPDLGSGWQPQGSSRLGDARRLGALPTTRCRYSSTAVPPAATVAVDLSDPVLISEMASFPFEAEYRTIGTSAALEFQEPLPGAASATILSFDSASRPLTTVALTATLAGGSIPHAYARRLAVIVTDDPRPGSPLPAVAPHLSSALLARLSNVVRISPGQARRSTPYPKNGALACQLAEALVAHWTAP